MRLLVVEDDPMIGRAMVAGLRGDGYVVDWTQDGVQAELALGTEVYDLALLDLTLPRRDGLELLEKLRRKGRDLPVIIVTARDTVQDLVSGLDRGADDYLVKPFNLEELLARVRAVIRRRLARPCAEIAFGPLVMDTVHRTVRFRERDVDLSPREFAVLEALMADPGAVVSRERLEESVYGWDREVGSNSIEVHLHHLRHKLEPEVIRNVRGVGYRLVRVP